VYAFGVLFLALMVGCPLLPEFQERYTLRLDVECSKCKSVRYDLYAPKGNVETEYVNAQAEFLNQHLSTTCPTHIASFLLPHLISVRERGGLRFLLSHNGATSQK
jgi:hypothetical protein